MSFLKLTQLLLNWVASPLQREDEASACSILFLPDLEPILICLHRSVAILSEWAGEATGLHSTGEADHLCPVRKHFLTQWRQGRDFVETRVKKKENFKTRKS